MVYFETPVKIQRNNSVIDKINTFLSTPQYIMLAMLFSAFANIFALELVFYTAVVALVIYVCLFGKDLLPLMPLFMCCYLAPSVGNNPGHSNQSLFFADHGGIFIMILGAIIAAALAVRIIKGRKAFSAKRSRLLPGLLILSLAYFLSGIGSQAYPDALTKNLLFALLQAAALILPFCILYWGVDWENARKDYFAWVGFGTGCLLLAEILWIYVKNPVVTDGIINRSQIFTGWGMHNNLGGILAMMIPFAFYLAAKYHRGWIGTVVGSAFLVGVFLTCSRTSILIGSCAYALCIFLMLHYASNRKNNTIALITISVIVLVSIVLFRNYLLRLFSDILSIGLDPSSRDTIYVEGMTLFSKAPIFGNSFYSPGFVPWDWSTVDAFSNFFPPRWHNTIVQLLASTGVVGLAAYGFHRFQTIRLFLAHRNKENNFIACSLAVLLLCSMFDCHMFNIGPVLFYSAALAAMESHA